PGDNHGRGQVRHRNLQQPGAGQPRQRLHAGGQLGQLDDGHVGELRGVELERAGVQLHRRAEDTQPLDCVRRLRHQRPQSVTIASLKVQVNVTYPRDSDLRIVLVHYDSAGFLRSVLVLSDFVGSGANFQNTIFDDAAATPIGAGAPPFAGSYRPSEPLSTL